MKRIETYPDRICSVLFVKLTIRKIIESFILFFRPIKTFSAALNSLVNHFYKNNDIKKGKQR